MFFVYKYEITIGNIVVDTIESINIKSSWRELTDTAEITLPRNLNYRGKRLDQYILRGDRVIIKVGYEGGEMITEFEGYVREVQPNTPVKIYCEDEMMQLKKGRITNAWKNKKLIDIITYIVPGYTVQVEDALLSYVCRDKTPAQVLLDLREYGVYCYFKRVNGVKTLVCGFPYNLKQFGQHTVHMQKNVRSNNLTFRQADDYKLRVKAIANLPSGKKTIEFWPSSDDEKGADLITLNYGELSTDEKARKKQLLAYAEAEYKKYKITGYRGNVVLFSIPVIRHGDHVTVIDVRYPEREGKYIVDSTILESAEPYVKRTVELGPKVTPENS
jgi:hypothetical protein